MTASFAIKPPLFFALCDTFQAEMEKKSFWCRILSVIPLKYGEEECCWCLDF